MSNGILKINAQSKKSQCRKASIGLNVIMPFCPDNKNHTVAFVAIGDRGDSTALPK